MTTSLLRGEVEQKKVALAPGIATTSPGETNTGVCKGILVHNNIRSGYKTSTSKPKVPARQTSIKKHISKSKKVEREKK